MDELSRMEVKLRELAVIVRYTEYESTNVENKVALRDAYNDLAEAESECARLNAASAGKPVQYFVKIVKYRTGDS